MGDFEETTIFDCAEHYTESLNPTSQALSNGLSTDNLDYYIEYTYMYQ